MNTTIEQRLEGLEGFINELAIKTKEQQQINKVKKEVANELVGLPYYWGEYSGVIEACESEQTKVIAHIKSQHTGEECYWKFDSLHVLQHLQSISEYSSWEEYHVAQQIGFAEDFESLLIKYNYSKELIKEKMTEYCTKFKIPYKTYFVLQ